MKIINLLPFVKTDRGDIGIAEKNGPFASAAWCVSEDLFKSTGGSKFGWIAPNGGSYTEDKSIFSRPTEQEVKDGLSDTLTVMAAQMGLIEI